METKSAEISASILSEEVVNAALVGGLNKIVEEWSSANRQIGSLLPVGWRRRGALAGVERAAYREMGALAERCGESGDSFPDLVAYGQKVYEDYRRGGLQLNHDIVNS